MSEDQLDSTLGLREQNRLERRARIREAARDIFCLRGYVHATTREIAARARVANGTLFRYATDKRELLFMVINDDLDNLHVTPGRIQSGDLCRMIVQFYRPRYEYFAKYPRLSRPFVNESFNFMEVPDDEVGRELTRNRSRRARVIAALAKLLDANKQGCSPDRHAAQLVHAIYLSACREWLEAPAPDPKEGLKRLDNLLRLAAAGFAPEASGRKKR
ncbi:TetR/AcrR family transcriptional regulator [Roseiarcaceae bacterium H3SJ34-1]|uniref:TetR/AcrR family transcriptional regulator n=1 Tax=Terripilifer ovatus TaxID=3032367 RepID=UPI003AB93303|nr:TetR/AcrR family transcriptional regulator [Roseiarcaceae bacterium H3SJ34-1]